MPANHVATSFDGRNVSCRSYSRLAHPAASALAHLAVPGRLRAVADEPTGVAQLAVEQERELVSDPRLMLVALCAVGNWTCEQIVDTYSITRAECVRLLARLDRQKIIELLPG